MPKTTNSGSVSRRAFLKQTTAALTAVSAPLILPSCVTTPTGPRPAPSGRVNLGCIGVGNQGINDMRGLIRDERVQLVAVCDVNKGSQSGYWADGAGGREIAHEIATAHYADQATSGAFKGIDMYADYRELLARDDIDAVLIAVPDHWHALTVVDAANAGKDIYAEKPLSLTIREGRLMSDAVKRNNAVFQTGSQQRSDSKFHHACELVRNGYIGKVHTVKCGLPGGTPDISRQGARTAPETPPEGFDYDFWLGPAPDAPYRPACSHVNWRWVFDYSGGQITDWGGHHPDIVQWGLGTVDTGPTKIMNPSVEYADHPVFNTATKYRVEYEYANGTNLIVSSEERGGVTFEGENGWIYVTRGEIESDPTSPLDVELGEDYIKLYKSPGHGRDFIDCVFERRDPVAPIEDAHRSISISHLGNIAMRLGRDLTWDPEKEVFPGDDEANAYLHRPYRGDWKLEGLPKGGKSLSS